MPAIVAARRVLVNFESLDGTFYPLDAPVIGAGPPFGEAQQPGGVAVLARLKQEFGRFQAADNDAVAGQSRSTRGLTKPRLEWQASLRREA
jgi:hypothetical protein